MTTRNAINERLKRQYFTYLREAKQRDESTVDAVAAAIHQFEVSTRFRDFRQFHRQQAIAFKRRLLESTNSRTGEPLSKSTVHATLMHLKAFAQWLAGQPGFKSRIQYPDAEYFNLSGKETRVAKASHATGGPSLENVRHVILAMPIHGELDRRNQAVVAFILLTGARDGAVASLRLRHVNLAEGSVFQDARSVRTKFSKSFTTFFFPVGDDIRAIFVEWVNYLRNDLSWGADDPLFPATNVTLGAQRRFEANGLKRSCWQNATPIRNIFRQACDTAGVPYFNPHSIRKTLVELGEARCQTPEEFKVWSQNLGHEAVLTTFLSYGQVTERRQQVVMRELESPAVHGSPQAMEFARAVVEQLVRSGAKMGQ